MLKIIVLRKGDKNFQTIWKLFLRLKLDLSVAQSMLLWSVAWGNFLISRVIYTVHTEKLKQWNG